ncbi:uroporphyrinogen decarboxylase family protein [bacterium]|nr:uroporphyrinogen decarboxylase family protein [bacterium]
MDTSPQARYDRVRRAVNLQRPECLPCSDWTWMEYRPELYHLGSMEVVPDEIGQVVVSADGKRRFTRDGGVWAVGDRERFRTYEDVLSVAPDGFEVEAVGPEMLTKMDRLLVDARTRGYPMALHYATLLTRATLEFGWEPFLVAAALEPERFGALLERFALASLSVISGWCCVEGVEMIAIHDDIAATRGPILSPDWCRRWLFPWYGRFFEAIHAAGRRVMYQSDGNYLPVLDDLLALKPDGLFVESSSLDPAEVMRRGGPGLLYLVKTDSRAIDVGTPEQIRRELEKLRSLHQHYPGMLMYRGGGNPSPENARAFSELYQELLVYS